jgi:hypothetical protein
MPAEEARPNQEQGPLAGIEPAALRFGRCIALTNWGTEPSCWALTTSHSLYIRALHRNRRAPGSIPVRVYSSIFRSCSWLGLKLYIIFRSKFPCTKTFNISVINVFCTCYARKVHESRSAHSCSSTPPAASRASRGKSAHWTNEEWNSLGSWGPRPIGIVLLVWHVRGLWLKAPRIFKLWFQGTYGTFYFAIKITSALHYGGNL